jgi:hypothetical protein
MIAKPMSGIKALADFAVSTAQPTEIFSQRILLDVHADAFAGFDPATLTDCVDELGKLSPAPRTFDDIILHGPSPGGEMESNSKIRMNCPRSYLAGSNVELHVDGDSTTFGLHAAKSFPE